MVGSTSRWAWRLKLEAKADPIEVRFEDLERATVGTRIVVAVPGPLGFGAVRIRRKVPDEGEIESGDEVFDGTFSIAGPARLLCMLLDAETRRLLLRLNAKSAVEIAGGELRAEMHDVEVPFLLPLLLDLGRRFAREMDVVQCLIENLRRDPKAGVRLSNLRLLVRECAWGPRTEEALRAACSDRSSQVRLRAAIELGPEGRGALLALAESMKTDDCAAQAIRILGRELTFERTRAILDQALGRHRSETARACLEALGNSGTTEAVEALVEVLVEEESEMAARAALALGTTGSATAEPPLIEALHRETMSLRWAAAKALGRGGSVAAVLPLKEATERFPHDPDLASTTRQAIAEIQSRLLGATPGQLSLAQAETGQLSLAPAEAGQLSLAADQSGQLSLPSEEAGQLSLSEDEEEMKPAPGGAA